MTLGCNYFWDHNKKTHYNTKHDNSMEQNLVFCHVSCYHWIYCSPYNIVYCFYSLIERFMGPTWGPSGADRTQVGPMLAPWTLLSGLLIHVHLKMDAAWWVIIWHVSLQIRSLSAICVLFLWFVDDKGFDKEMLNADLVSFHMLISLIMIIKYWCSLCHY